MQVLKKGKINHFFSAYKQHILPSLSHHVKKKINLVFCLLDCPKDIEKCVAIYNRFIFQPLFTNKQNVLKTEGVLCFKRVIHKICFRVQRDNLLLRQFFSKYNCHTKIGQFCSSTLHEQIKIVT